jgi:DNA-binding Lrp family transcriptional regulator
MARIEKKEGKTSIVLDENESRQLTGLGGEFELFQPKKGLLILTEKTVEKHVLPSAPVKPMQASTAPLENPKSNPIDEKLFKILDNRKMLSQRIEGKLEKTLNSVELKRFEELLKEGSIEKFKLSEKYKKPIYRLNEKKFRESREKKALVANEFNPVPKIASASSPAFSLEKDGFFILKSDEEARRISFERQEEFKKGLLRGIKSFDGSFFVMKKSALENCETKILAFLEKQSKADLQSISKNTQLSPEAVRIACEFLKEDGQIFEKTKNQYCLV